MWKLLIIVLACTHEGLSIKCWVCKSENDNRCFDPFDNTSHLIMDCDTELGLSHLPGVKSTMCRKVRQRVNGMVKIFRDCAYLGKPDMDGKKHCLKKMSGHKISMEYCTCNTDGCNTGTTMYSDQLTMTFAAWLTFFMFL